MFLLLLTLTGMLTALPAQTVDRLREVRVIYVQKLGDTEGSAFIREKIINRLFEADGLSVTEKSEAADAILKGMASIDKSEEATISATDKSAVGRAGVSYDATVVLRLVTQRGTILWVGEAKPASFFGPPSVSSSVANKIVKNLLQAIKKDKKKSR